MLKKVLLLLVLLFAVIPMAMAGESDKLKFEMLQFCWKIKSIHVNNGDVTIVYGDDRFTYEHYQNIIPIACTDLFMENAQCKVKSIKVMDINQKAGWIFNATCQQCSVLANSKGPDSGKLEYKIVNENTKQTGK